MPVVLITFDERHQQLETPLFSVRVTFVLITFHKLSTSTRSALVSSQARVLFQTEASPAYVELKSSLVFKCGSAYIARLPGETPY